MNVKFRKVSIIFIFISIFILYSCIIQISSLNNLENSIRPSSSYKISWNVSNNQEYLEIKAKDHYALGYAIGVAIPDKIYLLDTIIENIVISLGFSLQDFYDIALYNFTIPIQYSHYIQGVCDATGLSLEEILLQCTWVDILYGIIWPLNAIRSDVRGCTGIITHDKVAQTIDLISPLNTLGTWIY